MAKKTEGNVKNTRKAASRSSEPSVEQLQEQIRAKAYEFYLRRISTGEPGDDLSDWLRAEAEIKQQYHR
ncbi:MAG: hypothetical protein Kow009_11830 [Spirochaetales bacterium]